MTAAGANTWIDVRTDAFVNQPATFAIDIDGNHKVQTVALPCNTFGVFWVERSLPDQVVSLQMKVYDETGHVVTGQTSIAANPGIAFAFRVVALQDGNSRSRISTIPSTLSSTLSRKTGCAGPDPRSRRSVGHADQYDLTAGADGSIYLTYLTHDSPSAYQTARFVVGTSGDLIVDGTAGNDTFVGTAGNHFIDGEGGTDTLTIRPPPRQSLSILPMGMPSTILAAPPTRTSSEPRSLKRR